VDNVKRLNYAYLRVSTDQQDVDNQRHVFLSMPMPTNAALAACIIEDTVRMGAHQPDRQLCLEAKQTGWAR